MKKNFRNITLFALIFTMLLGIPGQCLCAATDVTSKLKTDKGIKWLTSSMCYYSTILYHKSNYKYGKKISVTLNDSEKYNIAGCLCGYKYGKMDYSDYFIADNGNYFTQWTCLDGNYTARLYKNLFGTAPKLENVDAEKIYLEYQDGKFYVPNEDSGETVPTYSIKNITKLDTDTYKIKSEIRLKDSSILYQIGTAWITVKKDKSAKYGYRVTKFDYQFGDSAEAAFSGDWKGIEMDDDTLSILPNGSFFTVQVVYFRMCSFEGYGAYRSGKLYFYGTDPSGKPVEAVIKLNAKKNKLSIKYTKANWYDGFLKKGRTDYYVRK